MSTPLTSTGPTSPEQSSQGVPVGGFRQWFVGITDWIKGLSPAGATQYDTGWVTITLANGFEAQATAPAARRIGKIVYLRGNVRPTTGPFTPSSTPTVAEPGGIPANLSSNVSVYVPVTGNTAATGNGARLEVRADGSMILAIGESGSPYYSLYSVRYPVD